jgi:hypothetical protein
MAQVCSVGKRDRSNRDALNHRAETRQTIPTPRFIVHMHNAA